MYTKNQSTNGMSEGLKKCEANLSAQKSFYYHYCSLPVN